MRYQRSLNRMSPPADGASLGEALNSSEVVPKADPSSAESDGKGDEDAKGVQNIPGSNGKRPTSVQVSFGCMGLCL